MNVHYIKLQLKVRKVSYFLRRFSKAFCWLLIFIFIWYTQDEHNVIFSSCLVSVKGHVLQNLSVSHMQFWKIEIAEFLRGIIWSFQKPGRQQIACKRIWKITRACKLQKREKVTRNLLWDMDLPKVFLIQLGKTTPLNLCLLNL